MTEKMIVFIIITLVMMFGAWLCVQDKEGEKAAPGCTFTVSLIVWVLYVLLW